jgi:hypothetical protein
LAPGFTITPTELLAQINKYITTNTVPGWASLGPAISAVKSTPELRWANPLDVKNAVEKAFTDNFGPKEAAKPKGKVSMPAASTMCQVLNYLLRRSLRRILNPLLRNLQSQNLYLMRLLVVNLYLKKDSLANSINQERTLRYILIFARNILLLLADKSGLDSHPSRTVIFTSVILKPYSLILALPLITVVNVICDMTTRTLRKRKPVISKAYWR